MSINGSAFAYKGLSGERRIEIGAPGMHHIANAATAMLAVEVLRDRGFRIDEGALHTGFSKARWPGRLQVLKRRPLIICDAAHNVSGTRSLVKSLAALGLTRNVTVFGVLRDKDYRRMLDLLARCSDRFVLTSPESDRALPVERLEAAAREKGLAFSSAERVGRAVRMAEPVAEEGRSMLICGSLYALGEAMGAIGYKPYRAGVC
jgi:dihydrofolate synthase/folylpolyglutamate synthase